MDFEITGVAGEGVEVRLVAAGEGEAGVLQQGWLPAAHLSGILPCWLARAAGGLAPGGGPPLPDAPARPALSQRLARWWRETTRYDTWNVGVLPLARPLARIEDLALEGEVRWLPPRPPLTFLADPFPCPALGPDWLLVEECGHRRSHRGRICRLDLRDPDRSLEPVITRAGHLSYPFVFEEGGETWCAPEMSSEGGCVFHRLEPDGRWRPVHHVLAGQAVVDPTVFRFQERWWLFFTSYTGRAANVALHACWAERLEGPWTAHALDPLKWDLASARPAGKPFLIGGRLYRPAQDCRETYGGAVQVMEVLELDPRRFAEVAVRRLAPHPSWPYPHGLHHLVVEPGRIVFDAKRTRYDNLLWLRTAIG